jgi:O-antigen/teichoic acid export membrane protein
MTSGTENLGRRMAKSAVWSVGSRMAIKLLGILSISILARLLLPADFGLVATATAFVGIVQVLSEFSFDLALIRDQQAGRSEYDTVWTMTVIRGAVTATLLAAGSGVIADFFADERLQPIMLTLAISAFIDGFANVRTVDFRKDLNFRKDFFWLVSAKIVSFAVTVACALAWRDYWALVAGILSNTATRVAMSYALIPYLPRPTLTAWRDITNFSKWYLVSNIVSYLALRCDTFVIGKLRGPESVGLYSAASEIAGLVSTELILPIHRVLNPGLAKIAHDGTALRSAFLKVLSVTALVSLPAVIGLGTVATPLVQIFLGPNWMATVPLIQVLVFAHVISLTFSAFYPIYIVTGRQRTMFHASVLSFVLLAFGMTTGVWFYGAIGAAYALVAASAAVFIVNLFWINQIFSLSAPTFLSAIWRPCAGTLGMAIIVQECHDKLLGGISSPLATLAILVMVGSITYSGLVLLLWVASGRREGGETIIVGLIRQRLQHRATH